MKGAGWTPGSWPWFPSFSPGRRPAPALCRSGQCPAHHLSGAHQRLCLSARNRVLPWGRVRPWSPTFSGPGSLDRGRCWPGPCGAAAGLWGGPGRVSSCCLCGGGRAVGFIYGWILEPLALGGFIYPDLEDLSCHLYDQFALRRHNAVGNVVFALCSVLLLPDPGPLSG